MRLGGEWRRAHRPTVDISCHCRLDGQATLNDSGVATVKWLLNEPRLCLESRGTMRSIVCINTYIPTVDNYIEYDSQESLRDYDIAVFGPRLPYYEKIQFTGGGSCISIEGTTALKGALLHWKRELAAALDAGKTVFVVLDTYDEEDVATGYTMGPRNSRQYNTTSINKYVPIPLNFPIRNSKGKSVSPKLSSFKGLHDAIKEIVEYRVVLEASDHLQVSFTAKDGTAVGGVVSTKSEKSGSLVLIPYFDFEKDGFTEHREGEKEDEDEEIWSQKALKISHALVGQLVAIDRQLRNSVALTPPPEWLNNFSKPKVISHIESAVADIELKIERLQKQKEQDLIFRSEILDYTHLLYESGKPLERAIEKTLRLLGHTVETLCIGDLEIDHIIVGPSGIRMICESEGKDTSPIDISKFRQLESNIGEDFERDEIDQPAKGILFGNGFRLTPPLSRAEQFTSKSLTNARRLGSALIRTADLYAVALYLLDHPEAEEFKSACRTAIEETSGGIVAFPTPEE